MGWKTVGKVSHTEKDGTTWERRVAYDTDTGKVERTFGTSEKYSDSKLTNRDVGKASSAGEALDKAKNDLDGTF
jgi:hypothetical protein